MRTIYEQIKLINQPVGGYINPKTVPYTVIPCVNALHDEDGVPPYEMLNFLKVLFQYLDTGFSISVLQGQLKGVHEKSLLKMGQEKISEIHDLSEEAIQKIYKLTKLSDYENEILDFEALPSLSPKALENVHVYIERYKSFLEKEGEKSLKHRVRFSETPNIASDVVEAVGEDCLWNFSISMKTPTKNQFLTLLVEAVLFARSMGLERIQKIGIFNLKTNTIYKVDIKNFDSSLLILLEKEVLGYKNSQIEEMMSPQMTTQKNQERMYTNVYSSNRYSNNGTTGAYYRPKKEKKFKKKVVKLFQTIFFLSILLLILVLILRFIMGPEVFARLYNEGIKPVYKSVADFMALGR